MGWLWGIYGVFMGFFPPQWEPQHRGRSCSELQLCDPQEPPEGLAAFLQERRIGTAP